MLAFISVLVSDVYYNMKADSSQMGRGDPKAIVNFSIRTFPENAINSSSNKDKTQTPTPINKDTSHTQPRNH